MAETFALPEEPEIKPVSEVSQAVSPDPVRPQGDPNEVSSPAEVPDIQDASTYSNPVEALNFPFSEAQGEAAVKSAERGRAGYIDTLKNTFKASDTAAIWNRVTQPEFTPDPQFEPSEAVLALDTTLDESELEYVMNSKSLDEFNHKMETVEGLRDAYQVMGDHKITAFAAGVLDLPWLAIAAASGGASAAIRVGRIARALSAAGVDAGATAAYMQALKAARPVTDDEVLTNIMLGSVGAAAFSGRLNKQYPSKDLDGIAKSGHNRTHTPEFEYRPKLDAGGNPVVRNGKPVWEPHPKALGEDSAKAARDVPEVLGETPDVPRRATARSQAEPEAPVARDVPEGVDPRTSDDIVPTRAEAEAPLPAPPRSSWVPPSQSLERSGWSRTFLNEAIQATENTATQYLLRNLMYQISKMKNDIPVYWDKRKWAGGRAGTAGMYVRHVGSKSREVDSHYIVMGSIGKTDPGYFAHEVAHFLTSEKLDYGKANPSTAHGRIYKELDDIRWSFRNQLAEMIQKDPQKAFVARYLSSNVKEFVAGLYTRDKVFDSLLQSMKDPSNPAKTLLNRMVDTVRRLLGLNRGESNAWLKAIGLADDLMGLPLEKAWRKEALDSNPLMLVDPMVAGSVQAARKNIRKVAQKVGDAFSKDAPPVAGQLAKLGGWNFHKTMSKFSSEVADTLFDNPLTQTQGTVDSWVRTIRSNLSQHQSKYDRLMRAEMAAQGAGARQMVFSPKKSMQVQSGIERELKRELERRGRFFKEHGVDAPEQARKAIHDMADAWEGTMQTAMKEMVDAGVQGAKEVLENRGYYPRRWSSKNITSVERRLEDMGLDRTAARAALRDAVAESVQRANPKWSSELVTDVATALLERARNKGNFSDEGFRAHIGNATLAEVRQVLQGQIPENRIQRVMQVLEGRQQEVGKAPYLKTRVDIDLDHTVHLPNGEAVRVSDLLEHNLSNSLEHYLDDVSAKAAFARLGIKSDADLTAVRTKMVDDMYGKGFSNADREMAVKLFDGAVDLLHGRPVGTDFGWGIRILQAVNSMVALGAAGLWQVTEYAKAAHRFGLRTYLRNMRGSFRRNSDLTNMSPAQAGRLQGILARNSFQDLRLRPYIQKLADGHDMAEGASFLHGVMQAKQLVPYANMMRWIQQHQANIAANAVVDTLEQAARGDKKAIGRLRQYGIDLEANPNVAADIRMHGPDTLRWADGTMGYLRTGMDRIMDDSVLRARKGELPAWAQLSELGRFLFTFRTYILGAHNKHTMGTMHKHGFSGWAMFAAYQIPTSIAMVKLNALMQGKDLSDEEVVVRGVGMAGALGLFSEPWNIIAGDQREFGTPGTIGIDRMAGLLGDLASGSPSKFGAGVLGAIPFVPYIPYYSELQRTLRD